MNLKNTTILSLMLYAANLLAQDTTVVNVSIQQEPKISYLDSIKKTFVHHEIAACVEERWLNEMSNLDLYNEMISDIQTFNPDEKVDYELSTELLKERLKILDSKSAFHIEYNPGLENIIKHYLKNRKKSYERLMALSQYYFPIFEDALAKYNVPLEIKYLAVVESALNPRAVSKAGATGLWQFMYATGKQYNLDITTFTDERSDLLKATEAACQYMVNMYAIFGDWDLVLASYNAGPGNVSKAIRRSGGKQNYWNIRPFLPKETQGYVPAFLATMYVFEFHKEHGIKPNKPVINHFATDTIKVKDKITFKQLSDLLDISVDQLQFLNPSYKRDFIPYIADKPHYLRLPLDKIAILTSNEDKIYAYAAYDFNKREKPFTSNEAYATTSESLTSKTRFHKVKRGETLGGISQKYGVSLSQLKKWNNLKTNTISMGRNLKIITQEAVVVTQTSKPEPTKNAIVSKDTVKSNVSKKNVPDFHVVEKGESLFAISQKYNVSKEDLKEWNQLSDETIQVGAKLVLTAIKEETSVGIQNYVIQKGDNLVSIAQKHAVSVDELMQWNNLTDESLKAGEILKIQVAEKSEVALQDAKPQKAEKQSAYKKENVYIVQKGDSLYSISQKIKGVTVSDLKKWNGISGGNIKPGMKLKISG